MQALLFGVYAGVIVCWGGGGRVIIWGADCFPFGQPLGPFPFFWGGGLERGRLIARELSISRTKSQPRLWTCVAEDGQEDKYDALCCKDPNPLQGLWPTSMGDPYVQEDRLGALES